VPDRHPDAIVIKDDDEADVDPVLTAQGNEAAQPPPSQARPAPAAAAPPAQQRRVTFGKRRTAQAQDDDDDDDDFMQSEVDGPISAYDAPQAPRSPSPPPSPDSRAAQRPGRRQPPKKQRWNSGSNLQQLPGHNTRAHVDRAARLLLELLSDCISPCVYLLLVSASAAIPL
jgi:hypothetical protein